MINLMQRLKAAWLGFKSGKTYDDSYTACGNHTLLWGSGRTYEDGLLEGRRTVGCPKCREYNNALIKMGA